MTTVQVSVSCDRGDITITKESRVGLGNQLDTVDAAQLLDAAVAAVRRALELPAQQ